MLDPDLIASTLAELRQPSYRARQVYEALTRGLVTDFAAVTTLPLPLREQLAERLSPLSLSEVETRAAARGTARKTLFQTADGHPVEAVLMLVAGRATVCVSSQVGCAVGCAFCASGRLGLRRDLTAEEIVDQVFHFARVVRDEGDLRVTNVVFMGMGEPFHNYDETLRACRLLNDPDGFGLAARGISVSTVGVVPGMDRFAAEPLQLNLAVSLHAATDELRDRLVPLNRQYPLDAVFAACERYVKATRRKLMFEYVVLRGVNDTPAQASALAQRLRRRLYHLNLIAYNETGGEFSRPAAGEMEALRARLERAGLSVTVRNSPGGDIEAACGQLALRHDRGGRETTTG
ncbi:MAG TPA: 23S rRNA (adenine(2503)-C(2))-methyltransferase RlmN [Thermoleophilia bacterium]|nr:23S rRNA (adenine(2503)-C(2))-methyltransferase RlmN [Thermoleophilia bacterium]